MTTAIVTTTINVPEFFENYCRDFAKHGRDDVCLVVVADKKTPAEAQPYCAKLSDLYGVSMEYFSVSRQQEYLRTFPELSEYLPYNSVQRRNIGMLHAYELGCDPIISVDDDNYLLEADLLKAHLTVGSRRSLKSYSSSTGWMNPCQFLTTTPSSLPIYHRGFPVSKRFRESVLHEETCTGRVVVNVGMWLGDPDVDAWVRMTAPVEATAWTARETFTLGTTTWAPFNSQQTAFAREVVPAYFLNPNAGRFDDIWGSFILHRIANHLGDLISYGSPIVSHRQQRSLPSLWRDIEDERMGTLLNDRFEAFLRGLTLGAASYEGCYAEIAEALDGSLDAMKLSLAEYAYMKEYVRGMRMWLGTFARLPQHSGQKLSLVR